MTTCRSSVAWLHSPVNYDGTTPMHQTIESHLNECESNSIVKLLVCYCASFIAHSTRCSLLSMCVFCVGLWPWITFRTFTLDEVNIRFNLNLVFDAFACFLVVTSVRFKGAASSTTTLLARLRPAAFEQLNNIRKSSSLHSLMISSCRAMHSDSIVAELIYLSWSSLIRSFRYNLCKKPCSASTSPIFITVRDRCRVSSCDVDNSDTTRRWPVSSRHRMNVLYVDKLPARTVTRSCSFFSTNWNGINVVTIDRHWPKPRE